MQADRLRKSVGAETTFSQDLRELEDLQDALLPVVAKVWAYCARTGESGRTVTLKVKYADFQQITRSRTLLVPVPSQAELARLGHELLAALLPLPKGVRLVGIALSNLGVGEVAGPGGQLALGL